MMNKNRSIRQCGIIFIILGFYLSVQATVKPSILLSPDKRTRVIITLGDKVTYSIVHNEKTIITESPVSMSISKTGVLGSNPVLIRKKNRTTDREITPLYGRNAILKEVYNELSLTFKGNYSIVFRAYNEGVAYRFETNIAGRLQIEDEEATFNFPEDFNGYFIRGKKEKYIYENVYLHQPVSKIDSGGNVAILPAVIEIPDGTRVAITESDIEDYPGMYLTSEGKTLKGVFRHYPLETNVNNKELWKVGVTRTADYIANTSGVRTFPWRIIIISDDDKSLMNNELVYLLSPGQKKDIDFSWVKTGNVVNDWWEMVPGPPQSMILTGVDFRSGTNYNSYKYNIDFAVKHNIDFVNMDYGWSDPHDFSKIHPDLDLPGILKYSREKNKKIMLWCLAKTLYQNLEENMAMFEKWGVAGLKVDFFERDDQLGINDYYRIAESAARHHLLLEYHGSTNPAGLSRVYPNILTYESVYASEQNMVGDKVTPAHNVTIPFIRTLAGPFDYLPGAMRNVNHANFCSAIGLKMTLGTRAHQVAMFVVYYSPLQFLVDMATNYIKEPEFLSFISGIPTTWDQSVPLNGKIGEYAAIARKKGKQWYIGAMTNWTARQLTVECNFLDKGEYNLEVFKDGMNADLNGMDYKIEQSRIKAGDTLSLEMAAGGGWTAILTPVD